LGIHNFHDASNLFPFNYQLIGENAWEATNASYFILPYIEQGNLFEQFKIPTTARPGQALGTAPTGAVGDATMWSQSWNGPMNVKLKSFICPSAQKAPPRSLSWGGPGSNYGWCTGSRVQVVWVGDAFNGIIAYQHPRRMKDVTDGLSNTLLASEFLGGRGVNSGVATYPFDVFYAGDGPFNSVKEQGLCHGRGAGSNRNSGAEPGRRRFLGNNGGNWAWYAAAIPA